MTLALSAALAVLWLVLAGLFVGVGSFVLRSAHDQDLGWPSAHLAFWAGAATVTGALLVWHLVLPANGLALALFVATGGLGAIRHRRIFTACLRSRHACPLGALLLLAVVWVANHALNLGAYDDYNYEFQAVRWNRDFPIVPGLANLHGRLGFNQSHHLLAAILSVGPLEGRVNHVVNGLFVSVLLVYLGSALPALWRDGAAHARSTLVRALLLGPVVSLVLFGEFGSMVSTLKADVLVTCMALTVACLLFELDEAAAGSPRAARIAAALLLTCALAISVKLSAAAFSAIVAASVGWKAIREARTAHRRIPGVVRAALVIAVVMTALVPARGILLSGYPAYPLTLLGAPVDWKVSEAEAVVDRTVIVSMARQHLTFDPAELARVEWLPGWLYHLALDGKFSALCPAALAVMCAGAALVRRRSLPRRRLARWPYVVLAGACGVALAVWWFAAPAPRFATAYLWILAACALAIASEGPRWRWPGVAAAAAAAAMVGGILSAAPIPMADWPQIAIVLAAGVAWCALLSGTRSLAASSLALICLSGALAEPAGRMVAALVHHRVGDATDIVWLVPEHYYTNGVTSDAVITRQTLSGLTVYIPARNRFETPLPNTRYFNPYLRLRKEGSLAYGFRAPLPAGIAGPGYSLDFLANRKVAARSPDRNARR